VPALGITPERQHSVTVRAGLGSLEASGITAISERDGVIAIGTLCDNVFWLFD
jgi:hypothetical protein